MALTQDEKERLNDSRLKLQSVARSLRNVNPREIPDFHEIESCLEDAERSLGSVLRATGTRSTLVSEPDRDEP
ncbi:MAG: hypothetical protein C5B51_28885 [Terriglobia bacterium]|nr:MAG: hypothetical protein C5B51_28885 [Terriglobia bacterium]